MPRKKPLTFKDEQYAGESPPQPPAEQPLYIAVVDMPRGPVVISGEARPRVYFSEDEAREDLKGHQLVRAFGCELFQIGKGIKL